MIKYRFEGVEEFLLYYAEYLQDEDALRVLKSRTIGSSGDAKVLAQFYWKMVDKTVEDDKLGKTKFPDVDYLLEQAYNSLHIAAGNAGFDHTWDDEIPD